MASKVVLDEYSVLVRQAVEELFVGFRVSPTMAWATVYGLEVKCPDCPEVELVLAQSRNRLRRLVDRNDFSLEVEDETVAVLTALVQEVGQCVRTAVPTRF